MSINEHPARAAALAELHARPAPVVAGNASVMRMVFSLTAEDAEADRTFITRLCSVVGQPEPATGARHHQATVDDIQLRWERHSEFVTYTFIGPARSDDITKTNAAWRQVLAEGPPGLLVARIGIDIESAAPPSVERERFICASRVLGGRGNVRTSFRAGPDGTVGFRILSGSLAPSECGNLVQWILEIETYRTLALLALPLARQIGARVGTLEAEHIRMTKQLIASDSGEAAEPLYRDLTTLASTIEAEIAACTYRFAAVRAYAQIVDDRLRMLGEQPLDERPQIGDFLSARLIPAVRTCESMQGALQDLASRCARSADLMRTRIDLQLARQNNELLLALNERTRLQMRLQQTVEGLSVAAVSYYIIGLIGYLFKGLHDAGWLPYDTALMTGAFVPLVVIAVGYAIHRVRRSHEEHR